MDLVVHAVCFNEEAMLPHFLAHYAPLARKIRLYDNHSTDRSVDIALSCRNVEVSRFDTGGRLSELSLMALRNEGWKDEPCDVAVVCDVDEFLHHPDLAGFLQRHPDVDVFQPRGYEMVADEFPQPDGRPLVERVQTGSPSERYSKMVCFRPARVVNMNYSPGSHLAAPIGHHGLRIYRAGLAPGDLKLLHYKNLGLDHRLRRHRMLSERLRGEEFETFRFGFHYAFDDAVQRQEFSALRSRAVRVIGDGAQAC